MLIEWIYLFRRVMATICCLFGLPGNLLTIIVCFKALYRRTINFERKVFDLYLAEISILDTCLLLYWVIETLFHYLYSINKSQYFSLMHISAFSCFFFYMINRLFAALCSWLITCFTFIRFLHIFRRLNTIRSNLILLVCLTIIFSLANSYLMVTLGYNRGQNLMTNETDFDSHSNESFSSAPRCYIRDEYADDRVTLLLNTLVAGFLNLALPSMLTSMVNIAIVCYIKRVYKVQSPDQIQRRQENHLGSNYRSTLLVISITYTLCYLPYCIVYLLLIQFGDTSVTLFYWSEIAFILRYISHSVNFYAYIFTNHRFRRDIVLLFRSLGRSCSTMNRSQSVQMKNPTRVMIIPRSHRSTSTPSYDTAAKIVCNYQRPTCIRFQNQNQPVRQQQQYILPINKDVYSKKQRPALPML